MNLEIEYAHQVGAPSTGWLSNGRYERFATLDGIRAVAALLVVTIHAQKLFPWLPAHNCIYLVVDLFFCLSGFVIARTYRERLRSGALAPGRFLLSRAMRFYPLYALALFGCLALWLLLLNLHGVSFLVQGLSILMASAGFLYLPTPLFSYPFPLNSPAWSLAAELVVNAMYAIFVRHRINKGIALVLLASLLNLALYVHRTGNLNAGWEWGSLLSGIARAALSFLIGAFLERHARRNRISSNVGALTLALVVSALLITNPPTPYLLAIVGIAFPALVFIAAHIEPSGVTRMFFLLGGRLSYGIYIIHAPLGALCEHAPVAQRHPEMIGATFVAALAVLVWLLEQYYVPRARKFMSAIYVAPDTLAH